MNNPKIWGPYYWGVYHIYSVNYPDNPSQKQMMLAKEFIRMIPSTLPCSSCAKHAKEFINYYFISNENKVVSTKKSLIKFFIDFHNSVNYRLNKLILDYDDAYKEWVNL